jgi:hypothetical protein
MLKPWAAAFCLFSFVGAASAADAPDLIRSARSGPWSDAATWEKGKVPGPGARVQVRAGHAVVFDVKTEKAIRFLHVAGALTFARDRDTRLDVGLLKIQPGDDATEDGFNCDDHPAEPKPGQPRPALEVGTPDQPLDARYTAVIRLTYLDGMDKESCPALVCCGGRLDLHGAPLSRTWVKLGATAARGAAEVTSAEEVTGWRAGDLVLLTATKRQSKDNDKKTFKTSTRDLPYTEERRLKAVDGAKLTLDRALDLDHKGDGDYRGEVANLSRNVVVESADPADSATTRGHVMYHRHSAGSISYAEFRHLGKEGVLGRYSLHYHLCGDTMRGSSVVGASLWDSGNRWLTVHGTNYLVVRDCIGYQSKGHGFFLEDATEVYNVFDRCLAVQAYIGKPLPKQVLPYDKNDGAGFWWANSLNAFTRNVAVECDEYGYFFQLAKVPDFDPTLSVLQPDGAGKKVDVRTLPFIRFEGNESHAMRRHALNIGGGAPFGEPNVGGVGPDEKHPFVVRDTRIWDAHWAFHPVAPSLQVDNLDIVDADYGVWRPTYLRHAYRGVKLTRVRVAEFTPSGAKPKEDDYPKPLAAADDLPPATVILHAVRQAGDKLRVRGVTTDNGEVKKVLVNGREARALRPNFAEWEVVLDGVKAGPVKVTAHAEDAAGNVEKRPHVVQLER